jgi:hypothetical protein
MSARWSFRGITAAAVAWKLEPGGGEALVGFQLLNGTA